MSQNGETRLWQSYNDAKKRWNSGGTGLPPGSVSDRILCQGLRKRKNCLAAEFAKTVNRLRFFRHGPFELLKILSFGGNLSACQIDI